MKILMIVQQLDESHWLRGFIVEWVRALAASVEHVFVLALEQGKADLPLNVTVKSMGKEKGYSRPRELVEFYRHVGQTIGSVDVIFSHMTPRYTWLAAPLAALYRKPQMLWFIHPKISLEIRAALAASRWIVTATPDSFPITSPKVHALGHGLNVTRFSPSAEVLPEDPSLVLAVGRLSPIKNHHILLEAAALLRDFPVQFSVVGQTAAPGDDSYYTRLLRRREELGLSKSQFTFTGNLEGESLVNQYRRASLITNLTPAGSFDKAALEGMLVGKPLLTANPAFDDLLGENRPLLHLESEQNPVELAAKIRDVLALPSEERARMGNDLRARTAAAHSLDTLMARLVALIENA